MRGENLGSIIAHNFRPYRLDIQARRVSWQNVLLFAVFPIGTGVCLEFLIGTITSASIGTFIALLALIGAVLTTLLALIQTLVGGLRLDRKYDGGSRIHAKRPHLRLEVLRELYANIAFSVLAMIVGAIPAILLAVPSATEGVATRPQAPDYFYWVVRGCSCIVYSTCTLQFFTFIHIIAGVYLILDDQAEDAASEFKKAKEESERDRRD